MTQEHATTVIDLGALARNVERIRAHINGPEIMAVVKADGYGHGLVPSARAALTGGASWLGVALLQEALALRAAGITERILAWLYTVDDQIAECIAAEVDVAVSDIRSVQSIAQSAKALGMQARVHVKVDTGLNRNGVLVEELPELLTQIASHAAHINLTGVMSHFAYADEPTHPTVKHQIEQFIHSVDLVRAAGFTPEVVHLANSAACMSLPESHFNLVRPGLAIYGISEHLPVTPVMTLKAPVAMVKRVAAGQGVSYSHTYRTQSDTSLALIPMGYADGIPRHASNRGPVAIAGAVLSVAGRVCMDQFMVDVGDLHVQAGDEVVIFGDPTLGVPSITDWANAANTISYEIMTRLGARVARSYINTPW